jgi:uncharacterized protein YqfA (UPF0365 family)
MLISFKEIEDNLAETSQLLREYLGGLLCTPSPGPVTEFYLNREQLDTTPGSYSPCSLPDRGSIAAEWISFIVDTSLSDRGKHSALDSVDDVIEKGRSESHRSVQGDGGPGRLTPNTHERVGGSSISWWRFAARDASRANIRLDWDTAAAIDLAGRDVLEAVQTSVIPKVILCPIPTAGSPDTLYGVAKDGIQLKVRVLVTVRTNLQQLIGGATESTVIARVGQGIVAAIGSCENYRQALADPNLISRQVTAKGLDSQTAFAIVSIDIADIDVGENVGARLRLDQAEADIRIARAAAESRRTFALAEQQEMTALVKEQQANLIEAESLIPPAIAAAFYSGHQWSDSDDTIPLETAAKIWRMVD